MFWNRILLKRIIKGAGTMQVVKKTAALFTRAQTKRARDAARLLRKQSLATKKFEIILRQAAQHRAAQLEKARARFEKKAIKKEASKMKRLLATYSANNSKAIKLASSLPSKDVNTKSISNKAQTEKLDVKDVDKRTPSQVKAEKKFSKLYEKYKKKRERQIIKLLRKAKLGLKIKDSELTVTSSVPREEKSSKLTKAKLDKKVKDPKDSELMVTSSVPREEKSSKLTKGKLETKDKDPKHSELMVTSSVPREEKSSKLTKGKLDTKVKDPKHSELMVTSSVLKAEKSSNQDSFTTSSDGISILGKSAVEAVKPAAEQSHSATDTSKLRVRGSSSSSKRNSEIKRQTSSNIPNIGSTEKSYNKAGSTPDSPKSVKTKDVAEISSNTKSKDEKKSRVLSTTSQRSFPSVKPVEKDMDRIPASTSGLYRL